MTNEDYPVVRHRGFNYEFLIFLILASGLSIFFLLYFNRLFASIVSYGVRAYTWRRYRLYIDIQALQISLLGGRVFFTGLRYHGSNESFHIQYGEITWRYWLRRVREVGILASETPGENLSSGSDKNAKLPCRIHAKLVGLEWFVYNRSPAYDTIFASLNGDKHTSPGSSDIDNEKDESGLRSRRSGHGDALNDVFGPEKEDEALPGRSSTSRNPAGLGPDKSPDVDQGGLPVLLQLFPIRIECQKAAAVFGNENTKAVLIVKADALSGEVDASSTKTVDPYQQVYYSQFEHLVVEMKENPDFKESQAIRARRDEERAFLHPEVPPKLPFFRRQRRKALHLLRSMIPFWRRSMDSSAGENGLGVGTTGFPGHGGSQWQGLSRYLDDRDLDDKARWSSIEYAATETILESPEAHFKMYWDVVSKVPQDAHRRRELDPSVNINGSEPPAWGIQVSLKGGFLNYGPWADRQRADLQSVFVPLLAKDAVIAKPIPAGEWRMATQMNVTIDLEDTVTLRVPIREESKNWRWRAKENQMGHEKGRHKRKQRQRNKRGRGDTAPIRPAGWFEIKVSPNASISYCMDMVASSTGFKNQLTVDLPSTELWSSVNHGILWQSGRLMLSCDLSNPLQWNALRNWHFNISCDAMKIHPLRDHIFLIVDMVDDWATGPPSDYLMFAPYIYHLQMKLRNLEIYLNVNDENIIDQATALDDNTYLILSSPELTVDNSVPLDKFRPSRNTIPFDFRAETIFFKLHAPQSNTQSAFLQSNDLGHGEGLTVTGGYDYNATTSPANTDALILNVHSQSLCLYLHGFVVRYFMLLKDNYFGDHIHFRTLDEYQEQLQSQLTSPDVATVNRPPVRKSNDLDVMLALKIDDPRVMLPTNLYSAERYVQCEMATVSVDMRFTNYYMDLELELSPLSLSLGNSDLNSLNPENGSSSNTQLFIDGLRVFGHRTFGLPPSEPTYLCNWDVSVGAIAGGCTPDFLSALAKGGTAFGFTFNDVENALVPYSSLIFHDVTFVRAAVESVHLWIYLEENAFLFSTDTINMDSNDWARSHYSKSLNILIPNVQMSCINADSIPKDKSRLQHPIDTTACLKTDIRLAIIARKYQFSKERKIQQDLVRREDQRTDRAPFLFLRDVATSFIPEPVDPPAQCIPPVPPPISRVGPDSYLSRSTSASRSWAAARPRSFLSLSSTSSGDNSVRRRPIKKPAYTNHPSSGAASAERPLVPDGGEASRFSVAQSSFHSTLGDFSVQENTDHSSIAFSSQYFSPRFSFDEVRPEPCDTKFPAIAEEELAQFDIISATLDDIDPAGLSEDHAQSSVIVEFPSGINAVMTPEVVHYVNALITALQPNDPEDVLDSLQSSSMMELFEAKKGSHVHGEISDIFVRLPKINVRFLTSSMLDTPGSSREQQDQYDFTLSRISLVTRTFQDCKNSEAKSRTSLQLRLGSAELSASERLSRLHKPQAAVMIEISDMMVSLGAKEVTYFDADVGSIVWSTASGKLEYLASLIHHTGTMVTELEQLLTKTQRAHSNRLKYFILRLLEDKQVSNDPSFLVRPSAVLRSAPHHLRTFDSWKMMMRLRQIWASMDHVERSQLIQVCWGDSPLLPADALPRVIKGFEQWRSWDLNDIPRAILMKDLFGSTGQPQNEPSNLYPLLGACRLGEIQFILDPGSKQNRIGLRTLTARLERRLSNSHDDASGSTKSSAPLTVVNFCCDDASVNLNWELCVLADDILRLYNQSKKASPNISKLTAAPTKPSPKSTPSSFHVAVELVHGSIQLETINLRLGILSDGLKSSFLVYLSEDGHKSSNLMLKCDAVTSRLQSHSVHLGMSQFMEPSLFLSHQLQETDETSFHTIKATASSQNLNLSLKQDFIGLAEVLDLLCKDEVAQLYRLRSQLPIAAAPQAPITMKERLSSFRINIAMFLEAYSISLPLVQSLTYNISGVVARAACAASYGKEVIFDFDVKENTHEVQLVVRDEPQTISLLEVPPTNGRITSRVQKSEYVLTILSSVEVMRLDASEIYNLLTALKRPQILTAIEELQQQFKAIRGHLIDIFKTDESEQRQVDTSGEMPPAGFVYVVHMTLASIQVVAKTSLYSEFEPIAQVIFSSDKVYLRASNRHEEQGPILRYPEVHLNLRHIGLNIYRGKENDLRSCGSFQAGITVSANAGIDEMGGDEWSFNFRSDDPELQLSPETISTVIDVVGYLRTKLKDLDTSRELDYLRKLRQTKPRIAVNDEEVSPEGADILDSVLGAITYRFELRNIRACWNVADRTGKQAENEEDLVLSIKLIDFGTRTKRSARLAIQDFQLQTVPPGQDASIRSLHSALLPQVVFNIAYVSTPDARRMAFQAVGESLDMRLTSTFIIPAAKLVKSISLSVNNVRTASVQWNAELIRTKKPEAASPPPQRSFFGKKRFENILIDADFAGAVVHISGRRALGDVSKLSRSLLAGKYGQFTADDSGTGAVLRSPGLAFKAEYRDNAREEPTLYGEVKVDASNNILYPSVVPLIMNIVSSIKEVVSDESDTETSPKPEPSPSKPEKSGDENNILTADPSAVLGRLKLNLGLRICKQEFALSCQPIARVAATMSFENFYFALNTVSSQEQGNFFAISGVLTKPQASVQHVYSRESTGSFEVDAVTLSFMNSKHVSGTSGVSAILNVSPMKVAINAKQVQDFLLFREIWWPADSSGLNPASIVKLATETSQGGHLVQRYQQVAATAAFPWAATISIASLDVSVDMGQAIGKSVFVINNLWASSKKTSDWEQNLCLGFDKIGVDCSGRLSGFVALQNLKLRTSIQWPKREEALNETPLVQASLKFNALRVKAAFDYQAFLVADVTSLGFLMFNIRETRKGSADRLVAVLDGEAVQLFGTATSAAQAVELYQAINKFKQERKENFESNLRDIEKFTRRRSSTIRSMVAASRVVPKLPSDDTMAKSPIALDTDVVVNLKAVNLGVFPDTFSDHQVFKMEALNAYARFTASIEQRRIHSLLKMTLGQLRIGLAQVRNIEAPKTVSEISVDSVVKRSTGARGGTILKVPRVEALMETWQAPNSNRIDYIFKSAFEGKVEVGWNYSRVSYIRGMWAKHSKTLEQTWGRQLPMTAVRITGVPEAEEEQQAEGARQKITAEVKVPQSKYEYVALEPAIIETPQLRDMGEATPPLEWIGLHRDKLPNLTHQIVIVPLLELAGEVDDAYGRILGST